MSHNPMWWCCSALYGQHEPTCPNATQNHKGVESMKDPLQSVMEERARQDAKWGEQNHSDIYWLGILMEEVGETAKAIIDDVGPAGTRTEITQVCAVALAWLECVSRRKAGGEG